MRSDKIPQDVTALASKFATWRRNRPHLRSRVPDDLMEKAVAAACAHSVIVVAKGIKIDRRILSEALTKKRPKRSNLPKRQTMLPAVRLAPLIVTPAPAAASTAAIEIENRAGEKLRLDVDAVDIEALIRTFLEDRR